jgi:hypothetical protein
MNIFLSYRFTGEDPKELDVVLGKIVDKLKSLGHGVFCSFFLEDFFKERNMSADDIYEYCLKEQEKCDTFLAFIKTSDESTGMEKELQKAQALEQKCVLAILEDLKFPHFREQSDITFNFRTLDGLCEQLQHMW